MANYTFDEAIVVVRAYVKNPPTAALQSIACDMTHATIWKGYPWDWTLGALTAIPLADGTQDYAITNADFWRLVNARITRTDLTPDEYQEVTIKEFLPPELSTKVGWKNFRCISRDPRSAKIRLEAAASVPSGVVLQIDGDYQKIPTKITATTGSMTQPDYYFQTFVEGLLYYFYRFTDDSRSGGVVLHGRGNRQFTGQYAVWMESLKQMAAHEDMKDAEPVLFPSEPLGATYSGSVSIYGP